MRAGTKCMSVATDSQGNIYSFGDINNSSSNSNKYFDQLSLPGNNDYFNYSYLVKMNKENNIVWVKIFESYRFFATRIAIDKNDNVIIIGNYTATVKIGDQIISSPGSEYRVLIAKLNPDGNILWNTFIKSETYEYGVTDVELDDEMNIYISGNAYGAIRFYNNNIEVSSITREGYIAFFAKYSSEGQLQWSKSLTSGHQIHINALKIDTKKNIYLTGWWGGDGTFESLPKVSYTSDIIIAKFNPDRELLWLKQLGVSSNTTLETGNDITLDENLESLYVTGGTLGSGGENIFLSRYRFDGSIVWSKTMGSWSGLASKIEQGTNLLVDSEGFIFLAGSIGTGGNFDGIPISAYKSPDSSNFFDDVFLAKYDATGKLYWVVHYGSFVEDRLFSFVKQGKNLFFCGDTYSGAKFGDFTLTNSYNYLSLGYMAKIIDRTDSVLDVSMGTVIFESDTNLRTLREVVSNQEWEIVSLDPWINVKPTKGFGNKIFEIAVDTNYSMQSRIGKISLSTNSQSKQIYVSQKQSSRIEVITDLKIRRDPDRIYLYPNPVNTSLNVYAPEEFSILAMSIFNPFGYLILENNHPNSEVDVSGLSPGLYILKIKSKSGEYVKRFIKM